MLNKWNFFEQETSAVMDFSLLMLQLEQVHVENSIPPHTLKSLFSESLGNCFSYTKLFAINE
jgi:hypothetical protein